MTLNRLRMVGLQVCRLRLVYPSVSSAILRSNSCSATTSIDDKLTAVHPGLQKLSKMKAEDLHHINPGPPNTYDDVPIPFKKVEEAKKDFQSTFNLYFYGSIVLFAITSYWREIISSIWVLSIVRLQVFVVEDFWPYDSRMPVKSYRERHKNKKPPQFSGDGGSNEGRNIASAAAAGGALAIDGIEKVKTSGTFVIVLTGCMILLVLFLLPNVSWTVESRDNHDPQKDVRVEPSGSVFKKGAVFADDGGSLESVGKSEVEAVKVAVDPNKLPEEIPYLLIGSGTASYYAALAIRARDANAKVLMIGDEKHLPYNRPALSKELWWFGDDEVAKTLEYRGYSGKKRDVFYEAPGFFLTPSELDSAEHGGISLVSGHRVVKLDLEKQTAYLDDGRSLKYQKCLIATGGRPKSLPIIDKAEEEVKKRVMLFRTIDDFRKLEEIARNSKSITIIGGSLLGSELANSLSLRYGKKGLQINQIFREKGNVAEILPEHLSKYATSELRKTGIRVMPEKEIKRIGVGENGSLRLQLVTGEIINTDYIITATGISPNTDLANTCGLEIDPVNGGYVVDAELRARSNVWVAGDASSFYDVKLGRRRVEHSEHAQITGRLAGENMTGASRPYWHQSSYYSILAPNIHFEAVGRVDSDLRTVSVLAADKKGQYESSRGVIFYLEDNVIVGVLLLNVPGQGIEIARRLIADRREHKDLKETAKLFDLHKLQVDKDDKLLP
ncbi:unnamed protein product [Thelazia callipaeda]|uniref:Pyr_redox_2 domain-containing protein n=1 Tax=Thelazia callipaeda TaxID=103827 RepID=A0A0N5D354_THECL|nr:unnamed protein product [Thelazia callipaeda]